MSKIKKNNGLNQYGAEPFEQQQFETTGAEGVNTLPVVRLCPVERTCWYGASFSSVITSLNDIEQNATMSVTEVSVLFALCGPDEGRE